MLLNYKFIQKTDKEKNDEEHSQEYNKREKNISKIGEVIVDDENEEEIDFAHNSYYKREKAESGDD